MPRPMELWCKGRARKQWPIHELHVATKNFSGISCMLLHNKIDKRIGQCCIIIVAFFSAACSAFLGHTPSKRPTRGVYEWGAGPPEVHAERGSIDTPPSSLLPPSLPEVGGCRPASCPLPPALGGSELYRRRPPDKASQTLHYTRGADPFFQF